MTRVCIVAAIAAALAAVAPASAFAAGWVKLMPVLSEANGFVASILVLTTFMMTDMRTLRIVAIFSNIAFITYSAFEWLPPVLILHLTLLPLNVLRLTELAARRSASNERDTTSALRSLPAFKAGAAFRLSQLVANIKATLLALEDRAVVCLIRFLIWSSARSVGRRRLITAQPRRGAARLAMRGVVSAMVREQ
jgi:hypothetical protein